MDPSRETIAIIGIGSVGTVLGTHLLKARKQVAFVDIPQRIGQIKEYGLKISRYTDIEMSPDPDLLFTEIKELERLNLSMVFVATKTRALKDVSRQVKQIFYPGIRVVCFQNGIGVEDTMAEEIGGQYVSRGVVNYACNIDPSTGYVTMNWFRPPNYIGPATDRPNDLEDVIETLSYSGLDTQAIGHREVRSQAFFKTILNSSLNAMCATTGITMAKAMTYPHTRSLVKTLIQEGLSTAAMLGYYYGEDALKKCMEYLAAGGDHYPSMWTDLVKKLPTEIDFINGAIVNTARQFRNLDVDLNKFFVSMIITEEIKNGSRDPDDIPDYLL